MPAASGRPPERKESGAPVRLSVRAKPRAKKSRVLRADGLNVEVSLAAPPADGAANEELVRLLAEVLSIPRRSLRLVLGAQSRQKLVEVSGLSAADAAERLTRAAR